MFYIRLESALCKWTFLTGVATTFDMHNATGTPMVQAIGAILYVSFARCKLLVSEVFVGKQNETKNENQMKIVKQKINGKSLSSGHVAAPRAHGWALSAAARAWNVQLPNTAQ